jgi:acyl-CoA thioester hydrolase
VVKYGTGGRSGRQIEVGFRTTANILQQPEEKNSHLHYGKGIKMRPLQLGTVLSHSSSVRVRYVETDQMGIVHHANYFIWMEVARVEYCRTLGFRYKEMELEDGVLLAVCESHCRYLSPARFDEDVLIVTTVPDVTRRFVTFDYEMTSCGRRLALGQTRHVCLNRTLRPTRMPNKYAALFGIR